MSDTFDELLRLVQQVAEAHECPESSQKDRNLVAALDELCDFYWRDCYPG